MTYRDSRFIRELGVPIPNDLNPIDWSVYYFCAPTSLEWSMAVRSAVRMLARGRFWLRDDRERSIKDAQKIGREIEMSLNRCDMSEIADAIKYFADNMKAATVTQTVNCGCGCGGGGGGGNTTVLDEPVNQPEDEPVDIVPELPSGDETGMTSQEKCAVATYLADSWVNNFNDIDNAWGALSVTVTSVFTWITEKFPPGAILPFVAMIISSLVVAIEAALLAGVTGSMKDAAATQRDDLICAVVNANSAAEAKQNFESVVASTRAAYGKIPYAVMILVAQMLDWNKIMGGEVIVPAEYSNADCSDCLAGSPQAIGGGWYIFPVTFTEVTTVQESGVTGITTQLDGNRATIQATANGAKDMGMQLKFVVGMPSNEISISGFWLERESIGTLNKFRIAGYSPGAPIVPMWDGAVTDSLVTVVRYVRSGTTHTDYTAQAPDYPATSTLAVPSTFTYTGETLSMQLGCGSSAAGAFGSNQNLWVIGRYL